MKDDDVFILQKGVTVANKIRILDSIDFGLAEDYCDQLAAVPHF